MLHPSMISMVAIVFVLVGIVKTQYFPGRNIDIPIQTKHLLYTDNQQYLIGASSTTISLHWGVNGSFIRDIQHKKTSEITAIQINKKLQMAVGYADGSIFTISLNDKYIQEEEEEGIDFQESDEVNCFCFTKDGQFLVYGTENGNIYIEELESGQLVAQTSFYNATSVVTLSCSPPSSQNSNSNIFIAGGSLDGNSRLILYEFNNEHGDNITEIHEFQEQLGPIKNSVYTKNGLFFYVVGQQGKIYKFDSQTYQHEILDIKSEAPLFDVFITQNEKMLFTVNTTHAIVVYLDENTVELFVEVYPTDARIIGCTSFGEDFLIVNKEGKGQVLGYCKQGQFLDNKTMECQQCSKQCSLCLNQKDTCYECSKGNYLDGTTCLSCGIGCNQCTQPNNCTQCDATGHFVKNMTTGNCDCYQSYYQEEGICKECADVLIGCILCTNKDTCTLCDEAQHWVLENHKCACQDTYYEQSGYCYSCAQKINHCNRCQNGETCTQCDQQHNWVVNSSTHQCSCKKGYEEIAGQCIKCSVGCLQCESSQKCLKCDTSMNFRETPVNGICLCRQKYYFNEQFNSCEPCIVGCLNCSHPDSCLICDTNSFFIRNQTTGKCICQTSYYLSQQKCQLCNKTLEYCEQCSSGAICDKCQGQLRNVDGKCTCGPGMYVTNKRNCANCQVGCYQCTNSSQCVTCDIENHFVRNISNSKCQCDVMYYFADDQTCKLCSNTIDYCIECKSPKTCDRCDIDEKREQKQGKCVCIKGYYENVAKKCQVCSIQYCITCESAEICTECKEGYNLEDNTCYEVQGINIWVIIGPTIGAVFCLTILAFLLIRRRRRILRESLLSSMHSADADDSLIVNPP